MMEQDIETLIQDSKDAQRYEEIQSNIKSVTKTINMYKAIIALNLGTAGIFGAVSYKSYSHNHDDVGMMQLITAALFSVASGLNYVVYRINKKKKQALLEEAKGLEAKVERQ